MPTPTYTPIASQTLSSSASSVTFSSIPATYRDLVLVTNLITVTGSASTDIRINGDTGSNYSDIYMSGTGTSAFSGSATRTFMRIDDYGFPTTAFGQMNIAQFMDYSATDKHKTVLARASNASNGVTAVVGRWGNTAAITSITFIATYASGSTFSLYGVIA